MTPMSSTNPDNTLTSAEVEHLNNLEAIVQRGLHRPRARKRMAEISDASLYRATHHTFDAYLRDRWDLRRSPENQLSQAAETAHPPSSDLELPAPGTEPEPRAVAPVRGGGRAAPIANVWNRFVTCSATTA